MPKTKEQTVSAKKSSTTEKKAVAAPAVQVKEKTPVKTEKVKANKPKKEYTIQEYGTGRRKNAIARVWVRNGTGEVMVNHRGFEEYFTRDSHRRSILRPFVSTKTAGQYDVFCTIKGGGLSGQAGALIHGIARALDKIDQAFHQVLRSEGFLTRDPRVVERKKYGQHKARKRTQFSKR
jgi:small subunit ribosomal protein S9